MNKIATKRIDIYLCIQNFQQQPPKISKYNEIYKKTHKLDPDCFLKKKTEKKKSFFVVALLIY